MQKVLQIIIHPSQTGFIKNRHLSENIMKIMEVINECETRGKNAFLVSFDFFKAFDTVEWEALWTAMQAFGFGKRFIQMVKILFNKPLATVSNNGIWSHWFSPSRACRQGCCFSPGIFVLLVETLGLAIRQNKEITGVYIGEVEIKAGQFADDLWSTLDPSVKNLNAMIQELEEFSTFSGLRVNTEKSAVLKLGPFRDTDAKFYTMKQLYWSPSHIRILGIQIFPDREVIHHENFVRVLDKVQNILEQWSSRNLSILGKIVIVNTLINTLFIHKLLCLPTPPHSFFKKYKSLVIDFIWG